MLKLNIITLFPDIFKEHLDTYPISKALDIGELEVNIINLRDFAVDKRGSVDDTIYGGGVGMLIRPEPVFDAVESLGAAGKVVLLAPSGEKYSQQKAKEFSTEKEITLICGRYEGVDYRVEENLADDVISIGDYVLAGGEVAAMVVLESISRLLPNVLEQEATEIESFSDGKIEFPQYTRPEDYKGMKVPDVLISGNHAEIDKWRENNKRKIK